MCSPPLLSSSFLPSTSPLLSSPLISFPYLSYLLISSPLFSSPPCSSPLHSSPLFEHLWSLQPAGVSVVLNCWGRPNLPESCDSQPPNPNPNPPTPQPPSPPNPKFSPRSRSCSPVSADRGSGRTQGSQPDINEGNCSKLHFIDISQYLEKYMCKLKRVDKQYIFGPVKGTCPDSFTHTDILYQ